MNKLRIAVALGRLGRLVHGKIDPGCISPFGPPPLPGSTTTGTVSGFLGLVKGLAERGNEVDAFSDFTELGLHSSLGGATARSIDDWPGTGKYDAYVSILETDLLARVPVGFFRIGVQWLNDFSYCKLDPAEHTDVLVCPSRTQSEHLTKKTGFPAWKIEVLPLFINPELYPSWNVDRLPRRPASVAYASSPDRGLHHLLEVWPDIVKLVPEATLRIYYRVLPWCEEILVEPSQRGSRIWKRAKFVKDALFDKKHESVELVGPLATRDMMVELCQTEVLAYPCDTVRFTEGFSVTVLDACAAGCVPIVSDADALGELWTGAAHVIKGKPDEPAVREAWKTSIAEALTDQSFAQSVRSSARARARELTRESICRRWEQVIRREAA